MQYIIGVVMLSMALFFGACGEQKSGDSRQQDPIVESNAQDSKDSQTSLVVGATPVPASEILEFAKPLLAEQGVDMRIQVFTDYVMPDVALDDRSNDANLYQHKPYMEAQNAQRGFKLVSLAPVYVVPLGFYSKKYASIEEIPNDADIALPSDSSNLARSLILLHDFGVIKLKDPNNLAATIESDIIENPKNLRFKPIEAAALPRALPTLDGAVINANYALQAGMSIKEAFFHENEKSEYVNVLVAREDNKDDERITKLKEVLLSKEVADFILEKYKGEIIPVSSK